MIINIKLQVTMRYLLLIKYDGHNQANNMRSKK